MELYNLQKKESKTKGIPSMVDFTDSPFSKTIAKQNHINRIKEICFKKLKTSKNTPIAKGAGIELRTWKRFIQRQCIKSLSYDRINRFCGIPLKKSREGIERIDEIRYPNMPMEFESKEGARLDVGIINEGRMRDRSIEYSNKDKEVINKIVRCSKKVIGDNFSPKIGIESGNDIYCVYFPPIFAKHYSKMNLTEKNKNHPTIRIPKYLLDNDKHQKIRWQGNMSEESSIYAFVTKIKGRYYVAPRIQLNRVKSVNLPTFKGNREQTYCHKDISRQYLKFLRSNPIKLMVDESAILKNYDIESKLCFSKIYVNSNLQQTATYTILINGLRDLETYLKNIGFELKRHNTQLELLIKFYK